MKLFKKWKKKEKPFVIYSPGLGVYVMKWKEGDPEIEYTWDEKKAQRFPNAMEAGSFMDRQEIRKDHFIAISVRKGDYGHERVERNDPSL